VRVERIPWKWRRFCWLLSALLSLHCTGSGGPGGETAPPAGRGAGTLARDAAGGGPPAGLDPLPEEELARIAEEVAGLSPLASHLSRRYAEDLDGLRERRCIRVLTTLSKTHFFLDGGRPFGFEYSLLNEYEKYLNRGRGRHEPRIVLEYVPVARDRLIPLLVSGYGDMAAAGLVITPLREKRVDFTLPYLTHVDEVVVANRSVRGLHRLEDLSGREIFVRPSSSHWGAIENLNESFRAEGLPPVELRRADESLETEDILEMVNAGVVSLTVADRQTAVLWRDVFGDLKVYPDLAVRKGGKIAWAVRKNSPGLRASLNGFLRTHGEGTLLGNIYLRRYFQRNRWIRNPFDREAAARREHCQSLIRTYAERYGFDWLLILALAYQESRLDHQTVSPAGPRGIMQICPGTASDENVDVQDIHVLENNIHAGVKYLAFLRDRYFSGGEMEEKDRIRFSLAAYNAGPGRVLQARERASEMGFDPNRWFRNVELAALELIGQGTVQYVSNINKYYLLFRFNEENEERKRSLKGAPPPVSPRDAAPGRGEDLALGPRRGGQPARISPRAGPAAGPGPVSTRGRQRCPPRAPCGSSPRCPGARAPAPPSPAPPGRRPPRGRPGCPAPRCSPPSPCPRSPGPAG